MDYKEKVIALLNSQELSKEQKEKLEDIFPELKESDDERIRKEIIATIHLYYGEPLENEAKEMIAWLEKQGEIIKEWSEMKFNNIQTELQEMVDLKQKTEQGEQNTNHKTMIVKFLCKKDWHGIGDYCCGKIYNGYPCEKEQKGYDIYDDNHIPTFCDKDFINEYFTIIEEKQDEQNPYGQRKESEDERTWIINYLSNRELNSSIIAEKENLKKAIAWLEKQGEQKSVDKIQLGKKYKCIASPRYSTFRIGEIYKPEDKFLCSLMNFCSDCFEPIEDEQKPAWSEEDEYNHGIITTQLIGGSVSLQDREDAIKWFKSLKDRVQPQNRWKPNDEQITCLHDAIARYNREGFSAATLTSLLGQLKKLKG